jgi:hypothetical protein
MHACGRRAAPQRLKLCVGLDVARRPNSLLTKAQAAIGIDGHVMHVEVSGRGRGRSVRQVQQVEAVVLLARYRKPRSDHYLVMNLGLNLFTTDALCRLSATRTDCSN